MRKKQTLLLACCLCAWLLSGCGAQPRVVHTAPQENIVITALFGESTSDPGTSDMLKEHIEKHFPNVTLEWENVDWGEQFNTRLDARIASGETPDLIIGKAQDVQTYHAIGALGAFPADFAQLLTPQGVIASQVDGALYGLTYNQVYQGVLYNKNIFYRFNLKVPKTLDELHAIVDRLESAGKVPFATHFQEVWYTGNILMQFALGDVFARQADWGDRLRAGEVSFSTDANYRHCVEQVLYQMEHTWPDARALLQSEADKRFADEEAVMYLTGSWSVQTLQSIAPYRDFGIFPYPNQTGDARLIVEPNTTIMKSASTPHDELINQICRMLITDANLADMLCTFSQSDSTLSAVTDQQTLSLIREDLDAYRAADQLINASVGNNQLIWAYQYDCAEQLLKMREGQWDMDALLAGWDALRTESTLAP